MHRERVLDPNELLFSKPQLRQLTGTCWKLRRLNRAVLLHLLKIRHSRDKQYRDACKVLALHASRMESLLRFWQEIVDSASSQDAEEMPLNPFPYICESCTENGTRALPESRTVSLSEAFRPDPDWGSEINGVLQAMRRTEERVYARYFLQRIPVGALFSAANRLTKALLQQRLHVLEMTPKPMKLVMPVPDETCAGCGKPAGSDQHAIDWRREVEFRTVIARIEREARRRNPEHIQVLADRLQRARLRAQEPNTREGDQ